MDKLFTSSCGCVAFAARISSASRKPRRERFPDILSVHAQRTHRLTVTLTLFALVLSERAGERLLAHIGMPTSVLALVRLVKRAVSPPIDVPEVLGVDDFAFRRGKT
ncbi:MAG TPA: hypothetical protein VF844_08310 [Ktedonobacteraceae bacterium]